MTTSEELRVLTFLHRHGTASLAVLARACLPGLPAEWVDRVVSNLDWLGYVTVYGEGSGQAVLQLTEKGRAYFGGALRSRERLAALRSAAVAQPQG